MIRRNVLRDELDQRIIRAALVASAFALGLGWMAQKLETRAAVAQEPPAVETMVTVEEDIG
jgi:hypothetical protein